MFYLWYYLCFPVVPVSYGLVALSVSSLVLFVFSSSSSSIWFGLAEMYGLSYFLFFSSSTGSI